MLAEGCRHDVPRVGRPFCERCIWSARWGVTAAALSSCFLDCRASASNVSHTVVLRPLKAGYFNFTSATVTYLAQEDGPVVVSCPSLSWRGLDLFAFENLQKCSKAATKF